MSPNPDPNPNPNSNSNPNREVDDEPFRRTDFLYLTGKMGIQSAEQETPNPDPDL